MWWGFTSPHNLVCPYLVLPSQSLPLTSPLFDRMRRVYPFQCDKEARRSLLTAFSIPSSLPLFWQDEEGPPFLRLGSSPPSISIPISLTTFQQVDIFLCFFSMQQGAFGIRPSLELGSSLLSSLSSSPLFQQDKEGLPLLLQSLSSHSCFDATKENSWLTPSLHHSDTR